MTIFSFSVVKAAFHMDNMAVHEKVAAILNVDLQQLARALTSAGSVRVVSKGIKGRYRYLFLLCEFDCFL